jgi:hypothetical protein
VQRLFIKGKMRDLRNPAVPADRRIGADLPGQWALAADKRKAMPPILQILLCQVL